MGNALYFGDCLDVMRESISDESVDLIYLDPPFNSKRIYNASMGGAQWVAFDDTWRWSEAVDDFHEVAGDVELAPTMEGLRKILGEGSKLAYLAYMANRLRECHRALKPTGSIYLHCDPTMNYLLRVVMDAVFGDGSFHNEVIWKRTSSHNRAKRWGPVHDTILFYSLGKRFQWNRVLQPLDHSYVERFYRHKNSLGRYRVDNLTGPGPRAGDTGKPWRGVDPTENSRHWELPPDRALPDWFDYPPGYANLLARERLDVLDAQGLIYWPKRGKMPGFKRYLSGQSGAPVTDMVLDIPPLSAATRERLGYPTQKPVRLLQRIIQASSNPDDVVLDPFCGCGTTIEAAHGLNRQWIGIDICVKACQVIERRMRQSFELEWSEIEFLGMPKTPDHARTLAGINPFHFERWAASLAPWVGANKRQRGDGGIDGRGRIPLRKGEFADVVSQVKSGGTNPGHVQAFNGARQQAGADMGIFTCFEDRVSSKMRDAAASTGRFYDVPVIQIYTVEDFFAGRVPKLPRAA